MFDARGVHRGYWCDGWMGWNWQAQNGWAWQCGFNCSCGWWDRGWLPWQCDGLETFPNWSWFWFWWNPSFRLGNIPFRQRAWQPDITGHTVEHFRRALRPWAGARGVPMSGVTLNMNTGSTVQF